MVYSNPDKKSRETISVCQPLFDLIKIGIFEFDRDIRIVAANRAAREIAEDRDGVSLSGDRLLVRSSSDQKKLREMLNRVLDARGQSGTAIEACNLERPSGRTPYRSLIVGGAGGSETAFVIVSDDERGFVPDSLWLETWFGFTPSEARLVALLAAGNALEKIARQMGICITTARTHLSRALGKTETSRQAELVAKILRSASLLGSVTT